MWPPTHLAAGVPIPGGVQGRAEGALGWGQGGWGTAWIWGTLRSFPWSLSISSSLPPPETSGCCQGGAEQGSGSMDCSLCREKGSSHCFVLSSHSSTDTPWTSNAWANSLSTDWGAGLVLPVCTEHLSMHSWPTAASRRMSQKLKESHLNSATLGMNWVVLPTQPSTGHHLKSHKQCLAKWHLAKLTT